MKSLFTGIALTALIGGLSLFLATLPVLKSLGISPVTLAIILGMLLGNSVYAKIASHCNAGIVFAKGRLLRLGIILYGFNLTFQQITDVGTQAIVADVIILTSTFVLTWQLGRRLFNIDRKTVILIGAGASICGAAAVMATEPVVKAKAEKVTVAVATVVIFGTLSMFLYPIIYHFGGWRMPADVFGVYTGATVHEVAQVYAAGSSISQSVADIAVTTKMIRVMMLAPFLIVLSWWLSKQQNIEGSDQKNIVIPWFAIGFIIVAAFNSLEVLPSALVTGLRFTDTLLLTMAMAALGVTTHTAVIKQAGINPLLLAAGLMLWLVFGGAGVLTLLTNSGIA